MLNKSTICKLSENSEISVKTSEDKSKNYYKLITTSKAGDYMVVCKYSEANKKYISRISNQQCSTPLQIVITIQITVLHNNISKVYEIRTSNRNSYTNSITMIENSKTYNLTKDSSEWAKFENILNKLKYQIDPFSLKSINLALTIIDSHKQLKYTPRHVQDVIQMLHDNQQDISTNLVMK